MRPEPTSRPEVAGPGERRARVSGRSAALSVHARQSEDTAVASYGGWNLDLRRDRTMKRRLTLLSALSALMMLAAQPAFAGITNLGS